VIKRSAADKIVIKRAGVIQCRFARFAQERQPRGKLKHHLMSLTPEVSADVEEVVSAENESLRHPKHNITDIVDKCHRCDRSDDSYDIRRNSSIHVVDWKLAFAI
jgi:hypothetical protein